jgi:hypothetical protein
MPKGLTMGREELDALAPLAAAADGRSSTRRLADEAKDVTGGPVPRMGGSHH